MSKPRYWWYGNVCRTIGAFPKLEQQVRDMSRQKTTPGYSSQPSGHSSGRAVEDIAVRVLSYQEYRDYESAAGSVSRDGGDRVAVAVENDFLRQRFCNAVPVKLVVAILADVLEVVV